MKISDISQEVLGCAVYPGDPQPQREILQNMNSGDLYNLSALHMCVHNGTHVDAPMAVHKVLLGRNIALLEGIRLSAVAEGRYLLNAAPLNIAGAEGSPCRAILIALDEP